MEASSATTSSRWSFVPAANAAGLSPARISVSRAAVPGLRVIDLFIKYLSKPPDYRRVGSLRAALYFLAGRKKSETGKYWINHLQCGCARLAGTQHPGGNPAGAGRHID